MRRDDGKPQGDSFLEEADPYTWTLIGHDFIECDVIRWIEVVWERKGPKRHVRSKRVAEREVVAEVVEEDEEEGWVWLNVLENRITWVRTGWAKRRIRSLDRGKIIKRKRHNITRKGRSVYRMRWSDESARDAVLRDRIAPGRTRRPESESED